MPRKSRKLPKSSKPCKVKIGGSKLQTPTPSGPQHQPQHGGSDGETQAPQAPQITQATLEQAGKIAQTFLNNMSQNTAQKGGSAGGEGASSTQTEATPAQAEGIQNAMLEGAVAGANAGAIVAAEGYSSLQSSPLVGGRGRGSKRGRKHGSGRKFQSNSHSHSHSQKGGMVPGLMTAVEAALVPLGLYLGQKALQSRRSGSSSLGNSFNFRRSSRRTRRRR